MADLAVLKKEKRKNQDYTYKPIIGELKLVGKPEYHDCKRSVSLQDSI